jgi:hypothetical protein
MVKIFCYINPDNSIQYGLINWSLVALMTGPGRGDSPEAITQEVDKLVNPPSPEVGRSLQVATEFYEGVAFGGLTEDEALRRIAAKDTPAGCVLHIEDESVLPAERAERGIRPTFRDAWEWSD